MRFRHSQPTPASQQDSQLPALSIILNAQALLRVRLLGVDSNPMQSNKPLLRACGDGQFMQEYLRIRYAPKLKVFTVLGAWRRLRGKSRGLKQTGRENIPIQHETVWITSSEGELKSQGTRCESAGSPEAICFYHSAVLLLLSPPHRLVNEGHVTFPEPHGQ